MFSRVKLATKMIVALCGLVVLTICVGIIGFLNIQKIEKLDAELYQVNTKPVAELGAAAIAFHRCRVNLRDVILNADNRQLALEKVQRIRDLDAELTKDMKGFASTIQSPAIQEAYDQLITDIEAYNKLRDKCVELALNQQQAAALKLMSGEGTVLNKKANDEIDKLLELKVSQASDKANMNSATADKAILTMGWLVGIGTLLAILVAIGLTVNISSILRSLTAETGRLTEAAIGGRLDTRGDVSRINFEFRDILQGINNTLDAVIGPLNVSAEYVDRISKGDIPPKITDTYHGDFNEIKNNLNQCIDALTGLIGDMNRMSTAHDAGDIDAVIDTAKFQGAYAGMAEGINGMVAGHITVKKKAMACVAEFGRGNFEAPLEQFPGKKAFINETIEQVRANLKALIEDANLLVDAAVAGQLSTRANASRHQGDFRKIVQGVNDTLDAVISPLNVSAEYVDRISKGDIPPKITDTYHGDFNEIKNNLNQCIDALGGLISDMNRMSTAHDAGDIDVVIDTAKFQGAYAEMAGGINGMVSGHIAVKKKAMACVAEFGRGNFEAPLEQFPGKKAFINETIEQVRAHLKALIEDANLLVDAAVAGKLTTRADASRHQGDFRKIVQGVNDTLDAVITPINEAYRVLNRLSVNDYSANMPTTYAGDFNQLATTINAVRERLLFVQGLMTQVAQGDLSELATVQRIGKLSEQDQLMPAMLTMMETLQGVIAECGLIIDAAAKGQLQTRGQAERFQGSYRDIVIGLNTIMDTVVAPITEAADVLARLAHNDLTARMTGNYDGDFALIKENVNTATDALETTVRAVLDIAEQVAESARQVAIAAENVGTSSGEVARGAQQVAEGSMEQNRSATEAADYMAQLQRAIDEVARGVEVGAQGAEQAAHAAQQAVAAIARIADAAATARVDAQSAGSVAEQGATIVRQTVEGMSRVRDASHESGTKINALGESSKKIGEIVEAINDIAEQTNLLALNAAIEAARAGEHGKGFAVVADEVRKLAERSAGQTKEIAVLIRTIQEGITDAVDSMHVATREVEDGVKLANQAGASLESILSATGKVVEQVNGVTEASKQVAVNAEEVLRASENVSSSTEQANAATEEMAASSSEVTRAVEHVAAIIEQSSAVAEELTAASEEQNASAQEMSETTAELAQLADQTRRLLEQFAVSRDAAPTVAAAAHYVPSNGRGNGRATTRK
jgi:methyl-accepting chemotaxis protein